jgi:hypothetical protein
MQRVHQVHEVLGRAEPRRGREESGRLVAPGSREGILGDRQELDVREVHPARVLGEGAGRLAVGQGAVVLLGHAAPRAEVHLVGRHRRARVLPDGARLHPGAVPPSVLEVPHDRTRPRRHLLPHREGVGLVDAVAGQPAQEVVLVDRPAPDARDERLPEAGVLDPGERMAVLAPAVEVAHHPHRLGVGGEDGERGPGHSVHDARMRAQPLVEPRVVALVEQVEVVRREERCPVARGAYRHGRGRTVLRRQAIPPRRRSLP